MSPEFRNEMMLSVGVISVVLYVYFSRKQSAQLDAIANNNNAATSAPAAPVMPTQMPAPMSINIGSTNIGATGNGGSGSTSPNNNGSFPLFGYAVESSSVAAAVDLSKATLHEQLTSLSMANANAMANTQIVSSSHAGDMQSISGSGK